MQSKISNWSLIFKYSSLQFLMKATFGAVNNIIFYNIFGPAILGVIKLSEVIISLPQFLNVGISNALMVESINKNNQNLITNFLIVKFITFAIVAIFILTDELMLNIFKDFTNIQKIFLVFLVLITIVYNFSVANNFIEGTIHKLPLINSVIIFISPLLTISLGYYFLFNGWFMIQFITFLIPIIYILAGSYKRILKQLQFKDLSINVIKNLFKKSPIYFFNTRIFYITELIIFVLMSSSIGLINAGLIAFCFRFILIILKLVGQTLLKRFFWTNISIHNSGGDISKSATQKIMSLAYMLVIVLPIVIISFMFLIEIVLPKYYSTLDIISLSSIIIFSELISGEFIRRLYILERNKILFVNLLFNIIFLIVLIILISNFANEFQNIFWYVSSIWFAKVILISFLSINKTRQIGESLFIIISSLFLYLFGTYFSFVNENNILIGLSPFLLVSISMLTITSFMFYFLNKEFVHKLIEFIQIKLNNLGNKIK